jgi:hypothetical protein
MGRSGHGGASQRHAGGPRPGASHQLVRPVRQRPPGGLQPQAVRAGHFPGAALRAGLQPLAQTASAPYYPPTPYANAYGGGYSGAYGGSPAPGTYGGTPYSGAAGGYGTPSGSYGDDPFAGSQRSSADIIGAEGRFRLNNLQANLIKEQVRGQKIENRRKILDEWVYERANLPTRQDERERLAKLDLRYHLTNPAPTEIYSGTSLNTILDQLKQMQARGVRGPTVPIGDDLLEQINVTTGTGGNVGLLKNDGRLTWPLALSGPDFEAERKDLERNLPVAVSEVQKHGRVDRGRIKDMRSDVERMLERLARMIGELTPSQCIEAKRYLNQLNDGLRILETPDAVSYLTGKYKAQGRTVGDLVRYMSNKGLRFAPAVAGDESAYRALHQALTTSYGGTQQLSREGANP